MEMIQPPRVMQRPQRDCLGIRVVTPFRGMLRTRDDLMSELADWIQDHGVDGAGPFFLRLHVIDMNGPMDLEVGVVTPDRLAGDARVRPAVLPAGRYASLTYRNHAMRANRALLEWARDNDIALNRSDGAQGGTGSRAGTRHTSPIREPSHERRSGRSNSTSAWPNQSRVSPE
jgi:hypothetical protein